MRSVQRGISAFFLVIAILAIAVAVTAGYFVFSQNLKQKIASINSFEECAKHYPVMESYPEQCNTPDGKHFTKPDTQLIYQDESYSSPEPADLGKQIDWSNQDYYFQGNFYKFSFPANHKAETGAYGCNPIIIKPIDGSINGTICVVESSFDNNLESLLTMAYGEKLLTSEDIVVNGHKAIIIEIERDRGPVISITAAVKDVPFIVGYGSGKQEKLVGILSFS